MNVREHYEARKDGLKASLKSTGEKVAKGVVLATAPLLLGAAALRKTIVEFTPGADIGLEPNTLPTSATYDQATGVLTVEDGQVATGKIGPLSWVADDYLAKPGQDEGSGQMRWGFKLRPRGRSYRLDRTDGIETAYDDGMPPKKFSIRGVRGSLQYQSSAANSAKR